MNSDTLDIILKIIVIVFTVIAAIGGFNSVKDSKKIYNEHVHQNKHQHEHAGVE